MKNPEALEQVGIERRHEGNVKRACRWVITRWDIETDILVWPSDLPALAPKYVPLIIPPHDHDGNVLTTTGRGDYIDNVELVFISLTAIS